MNIPDFVGTLPDYLAAAVAALALFWASRAANAAVKTNEQQSKQLEALEADQQRREAADRQAQASRIVAWCERDPNDEAGTVLRFLNGSDAPVYAVEVSVVDEDFEGAVCVDSFTRWSVPPTSEPIVVTVNRPTLGGGIESSPFILDVYVQFRDTAGNFWVRGQDGQLTEVVGFQGGPNYMEKQNIRMLQIRESPLEDRR